jgi:hypothetical protein
LGEISVIADNRFDRILDEVWKEVKDLKRGVLYKTIFILDPQNAIHICESFGIQEFDKFNDDIHALDRIKYLSDLLNETPMKQAINLRSTGSPELETFTRGNSDNLTDKLSNLLGFSNPVDLTIRLAIIGIALILVALYLLNRRKQPNSQNISTQLPDSSIAKSDATLCLVVPTKRIDREFRNILLSEDRLTQEVTKALIDRSVYFIACENKDLDSCAGGLDLSNQPIDYDLNGDIYIELLIPLGGGTIDNDMKRMLLRNLPVNNAIIQKVKLLNTLSNIDRFHTA